MDLKDLLPAITSVAAVWVAVIAHRYSRQQQRESWLRTFQEMHKAFWEDPNMKLVRLWIACDSAYQSTLLPVLTKRLAIKNGALSSLSMSAAEYEPLEVLEAFLNLVLRIDALSRRLELPRSTDEMWQQLSLNWWLREFIEKRPGLIWYGETFYEHHVDGWRVIAATCERHHSADTRPVRVPGDEVFDENPA